MKNITTTIAALAGCASLTFAQAQAPAPTEQHARVILLTDIGNEPDDSESFVRFLLYANHFDIEGIIASTSTHQRDKVQPQLLQERIAAYAEVLPNLHSHAPGYPDADQLAGLVRSGVADYGMAGVGDSKDTDASRLIIEAVDREDTRPVWIPIWGGATDLAQALWNVRANRTSEEVSRFTAKLRVYSISDQDDAGPWIRRNFPDIFWIASVHGWNQYSMAAWTGISGDVMRAEKWPSAEMVTNEWLESNIRLGPLGALYPPHQFIMEGDTPSFLSLIPNGLNVPEHPDWGGWGGRYVKSDLSAGHYGDAADTFVSADGTRFISNQATVFRWREAFQNDFAARIQWSLAPRFEGANHNPEVVLNDSEGLAPVYISARPGGRVLLDASGSVDPDGDILTYGWWQYPELSGGFRPPMVTFEVSGPQSVTAVIPDVQQPATIHIILEITDDGSPSLTSYRRAIIEVVP